MRCIGLPALILPFGIAAAYRTGLEVFEPPPAAVPTATSSINGTPIPEEDATGISEVFDATVSEESVEPPPPTCSTLERTNCTADEENCAASPTVLGGTFDSDVHQHRLRGDWARRPRIFQRLPPGQIEVTVGRFREFVCAWNAGWRPPEGLGKHAYLNGGLGLNAIGPGYESGGSRRMT